MYFEVILLDLYSLGSSQFRMFSSDELRFLMM